MNFRVVYHHCLGSSCWAWQAVLSKPVELTQLRQFYLASSVFRRISEMLGVCAGHVTWSRSPRTGVVALPLTKTSQRTGAPEQVTFDDGLVGSIVAFALRGRARGGRLFQGTANDFRRLWRVHLVRLGLDPSVFLPYSLQRGGATQRYVEFGQLTTSSIAAAGIRTRPAASTSSRASASSRRLPSPL